MKVYIKDGRTHHPWTLTLHHGLKSPEPISEGVEIVWIEWKDIFPSLDGYRDETPWLDVCNVYGVAFLEKDEYPELWMIRASCHDGYLAVFKKF